MSKRSAAQTWVDYMTGLDIRSPEATASATLYAYQLKAAVTSGDDCGKLAAELDACERVTRDTPNQVSADIADIFKRAADNLRARAGLNPPPSAFLQGHVSSPETGATARKKTIADQDNI